MNFWKGKNVLVTGAHGFTGTHLCEALLENEANVRAFVRRGGNFSNLFNIIDKLDLFKGDLTDITSVMNSMKGIDYVFHAGAIVNIPEARSLPGNTFQVNTMGTFNVAWAARRENIKRMLYISTCHVYGNVPEDKIPIKEDTVPNPPDIYSCAKYAGEIVCRSFLSEGFDIVITRAFNKYGPYQKGDFFIPKVLSQVLKGQNPKLGNPTPTRDYSFVRDIIKGYLLAAEKGKTGEIYNFSSGKEISIGDLCDKIIQACEMRGKVKPIWSIGQRKIDIMRFCGDYSKAKKELGWEPKTSLEEGLRITVDWWKKNINNPLIWKIF
jgi:dTDP-glucose 4,6-dehydratase